MRAATEMIHRAQGANRDADPLTLPIYETTTFVFENAEQEKAYTEGRSQRFLYSRSGTPTIVAGEAAMAGLEGAEAAMLLSSGMAATATALLALLKAGDEVICSSAIYGGTLPLLAAPVPHSRAKAR